MKINNKILSIPPYISTSWKNISSLHLENQDTHLVLIVTLNNGTRIEVPQLDVPIIEAIFATHAQFIEQEDPKRATSSSNSRFPLLNLPNGQEQIFSFGIPLKGIFSEIENMGSFLQHNPEQANMPDLAPDLLHKVAALSKTLGIEDPNILPKAEPHCNCMHCQIARAIQNSLNNGEESTDKEANEEIVTEEDLRFRTWDVLQTGDKLYVVSNPIDNKEHYNVYLGEPIGCTCGEKQCEHIKAVLST